MTKEKLIGSLPRPFEIFIGDTHRKENTYLNKFEKKIYSQNGEDWIINQIFKKIQRTNKYYVEPGKNVFFVLNETLQKQHVIKPASIYKAYYPVAFGRGRLKFWMGHKKASQRMEKVQSS